MGRTIWSNMKRKHVLNFRACNKKHYGCTKEVKSVSLEEQGRVTVTDVK